MDVAQLLQNGIEELEAKLIVYERLNVEPQRILTDIASDQIYSFHWLDFIVDLTEQRPLSPKQRSKMRAQVGHQLFVALKKWLEATHPGIRITEDEPLGWWGIRVGDHTILHFNIFNHYYARLAEIPLIRNRSNAQSYERCLQAFAGGMAHTEQDRIKCERELKISSERVAELENTTPGMKLLEENWVQFFKRYGYKSNTVGED